MYLLSMGIIPCLAPLLALIGVGLWSWKRAR